MPRHMPPNHVENETVRIAALSNNKLVEETIGSAGGDDYDGCTFDLLQEELKRRLVAAGFATDGLWRGEE